MTCHRLRVERLEDRVNPTVIPFATQTITDEADGATDGFAADLDGDGDMDVLVASTNDGTVRWYENDGFGGFTEHIVDDTLSRPGSVFAADLDGDGDMDVLVADFLGDAVYWYENDGSGTFGIASRHTIATNTDLPKDVTAVDLNGNGNLDVLYVSPLDNEVVIYPNTGGGVFSSTPLAATFPGANAVLAADFNHDGFIDIVAGSSSTGEISIYTNTGVDFAFNLPVSIGNTPQSVSDLEAADVTGDGNLDIVAASGTENRVYLYANDGNLNFTRSDLATTLEAPSSVHAADLDGDGDIDVVVASRNDDTISWIENTGGTYITRTIFTGADAATSVFVADMDRDGDLDVLSTSEFDDSVRIHRNQTIHGSATFPVGTDIAITLQSPRAISYVDLDGDGDLDIIAASHPDNTLAWYENDGFGNFTERIITTSATGANDIKAADLDGDGDIDLYAALNNRVVWYENDGSQNFTEHLVGNAQIALSVHAGDWDGDGDLDIIAASALTFPNQALGGVIHYENRLNEETNDFNTVTLLGNTAGVQSVFNADVNRDGNLDVIYGQNNGVVALITGTGQFGVTGQFVGIDNNAGNVRSVVAGDVDHDGDLDVFAASFDQDVVYAYINEGNQTFTRQTAVFGAEGAVAVAIADADRDGDLDLFGGAFTDDSVFYSQYSEPAFFPEFITSMIVGINDLTVADLNRDGKPDLIVAAGNSLSSSTPRLVIFENKGGQFALPTENIAPTQITSGEEAALLKIDFIHRGRPGDSDAQLSTLELRLDDGNDTPLTLSEFQALFQEFELYRDTNGNGVYDPGTDTAMTIGAIPTFINGVFTFVFNNGDPNVTVNAPGTLGGTTQQTYFVVGRLSDDADTQTPNTFALTHLTETSSTAMDAVAGIPLQMEFEANTSTGPITAMVDEPAEVVSIDSPTGDGIYGIGETIQVTITFSETVTLTGGNLTATLDSGGSVTFSPFTNQTSVTGTYTVGVGDESPDLDVTALTLSGGATLRDADMNETNLTLPSGNSLADNADLVVDGIAPNTPTVDVFADDTGEIGDGITADQTLLIGGTAEPNATVEVFRNGSSIGNTMANNSGNWSFADPDTLSDGVTYAYTAIATDAAMNSSATSAPLTVTIDATAPDAPVITGIEDDTDIPDDGITSDQTLTVLGTAEANSLVELFRDGTSIGTTLASSSGDWSLIDPDTLPEGTYDYTATATDVAGNVSTISSTFTVTVILPPLTVTITGIEEDTGTSSSDGITSDTTLSVVGTTDPGATVEVFRNGVSLGTITASSSGQWSYDDSMVLTDGTYIYTARASEGTSTGALTEPFTAVVDTTPPFPPEITDIDEDTGIPGDGVTTDNTLLISGTAEGGAIVEIFLDGESLGTTTANSSGSWTFDNTGTSFDDGTYELTATATDLAGNTSETSDPFRIVVNTTGVPVITGIDEDTGSSPTDGITRDTSLTILGVALPSVTVQVFRDGTLLGSTTANFQGAWSFDDPNTLGDATYEYTARATGLSGSMLTSEPFPVVVDTTAPVLTVDPKSTTSTSPEITGTIDSMSAIVTVMINGQTYTAVNNENGTWTLPAGTISPDLAPGTYDVTASSTDLAGNTGIDPTSGELTITSALVGGGVSQSEVSQFSVGAGPGGSTGVSVFNPDGSTAFTVTPFSAAASPGGIRTAVADVNGDGVPDLIVGAGPGGPPMVRVFDGITQQELFAFNAFEASFLGGVYVAAGDINGDGFADIVVTPDEGGGPRVRIISGANGSQINDFFGIEDPNFRGGARAALADIDGDGRVDLIVAAGFGGGPRIAIFNGTSVASGSSSPGKLRPDFFAFEQTLRNGVFISGGDVDGDGMGDVIAGGGPGGGPRVLILSGARLLDDSVAGAIANPVGNFFAGDVNNRGGIRVVAKDLDGDAHADLIVGAGEDAGSAVTAYRGSSITPNGTPPSLLNFAAFPGFGNGVFVG